MPLQNRVHPTGKICATPERGAMLGNRGGKFHRDDQTLGKRRWASRHWICCELHYRNMHHEPMGKGYTSLFFLDEVTALAVGHRPCFFCRRTEAKAFIGLSGLTTNAFDDQVHAERTGPHVQADLSELPDGAMVEHGGGCHAVNGTALLRWTFGGYAEAMSRASIARANLLTPPTIIAILAQGYKPRWHPSALARGTT